MQGKVSLKKGKDGNVLVSVKDYEAEAKKVLPKMVYDYYASGATDETTLRENERAFNRIKMRPKVLVDVRTVDTGVEVFGAKMAHPVFVAPSAMHCLANSAANPSTQGRASANDIKDTFLTVRAAVQAQTIFTLSTWATQPLEEVMWHMKDEAKRSGLAEIPMWMQLYVVRDRAKTERLVRHAEGVGFTALALTVDTPVLGKREADRRNGFALPDGLSLPNLDSDGAKGAGGVSASIQGQSFLTRVVETQQEMGLTWDDVPWLKSLTKMRVVLKGIVRGDDAVKACEVGVDGIIVSNHGARQIDTEVATIEVLPEVCNAVNGFYSQPRSSPKPLVFLDGGVRRGTDVMKALCLGATGIFIGRPILWGLATNGQEGVLDIIKILIDELILSMRICGCTNLSYPYLHHSQFLKSVKSRL